MNREKWLRSMRRYGLGLALVTGACSGSQAQPDAGPPFEPLTPQAYVTKVKDLMTGLAPTDAEIQAVVADPTALGGLIDQWFTTPQAQAKLLSFFELAFQQTQINIASFNDQLVGMSLGFQSTADSNQFVESAKESFARTVLNMVNNQGNFTQVVNTTQVMMNIPLMAYYAYHDSWDFSDVGKNTNQLAVTGFTATFGTGVAATSYQDSVTPTSPNYLQFKLPSAPTGTGCTNPYSKTGNAGIQFIYNYMFGNYSGCLNAPGNSQFTAADWSNWRLINIRQPKTGEKPTVFWDIQNLRNINELVLRTPQMGFMTTPAFLANWSTNSSNQHRVTMNQTMIVALTASFDDSASNNIPSIDLQTSPTSHIQPGTVCYSCHQTLDPMRQLIRQSLTLFGTPQMDQTQITTPGNFAFSPVENDNLTGGLTDLANNIIAHPRFPVAWAQKLCYYAQPSWSEAIPRMSRV